MKNKVAYRDKYGKSNVLSLREIEIEPLKNDDILIENHYTTVNRTDQAILNGSPSIIQVFTGFGSPSKNYRVTGTDFAGIVIDKGKNVENFQIGDKICGFNDQGLNTHAQYIKISKKREIIKVPNNVELIDAAAVLEAGHYAINFLNKLKINKSDKIIINSGTGAIGSIIMQLLKSQIEDYENNLIITSREQHIDLIKSYGFKKIINYEIHDFTQLSEYSNQFDFVLDAVGKSSFRKSKNILKRSGKYLSSELGDNSENIFYAIFSFLMPNQKVIFPIPTNIPNSLKILMKSIEKGEIRPMIDRIYNFENIRDAYDYVSTGQKVGSVVINIK